MTALVLGPPAQPLFCAAADEDQASLLFQDVLGKFQRNPLLAPLGKVTRRVLTVPSLGDRWTPAMDPGTAA